MTYLDGRRLAASAPAARAPSAAWPTAARGPEPTPARPTRRGLQHDRRPPPNYPATSIHVNPPVNYQHPPDRNSPHTPAPT